MRQIRILLPEKKDVIRWGKILRFKLTGGFSCTTCGAKSNFDHVQFDSEVNGKRFMLSNSTAGICPKCTQDELNDKSEIVFTEDNCTCDWCSKSDYPTTSFPRHNDFESQIVFGSQWWNGHHICQNCLNNGFVGRGPTYSSHSKHENGKHYHSNELGMWIEVK